MKRSSTITSTLLFLAVIAFDAVAATEMNVVASPNAVAANDTHALPVAAAQANLTAAERGQVDEHMRRTLTLLNSMTPKQRAQALTAMSTSDSALDRYVCQLVTVSDDALVRHMNEKLSLIKSIPEEQRPQIVASMLNSHNSADRNLAEVIIKHNDQGGDKTAQRLKALSQLGPHDRAELVSRLANSTIESDRQLARAALAESAPKGKGDDAIVKPTSPASTTGNGVAPDTRSAATNGNLPAHDARTTSVAGISNGNWPTPDYRTATPAPASNGQAPAFSAPSANANGIANGMRPDVQSMPNGVMSAPYPQGLPTDRNPSAVAGRPGGIDGGLSNGAAGPQVATPAQSQMPTTAGGSVAPVSSTSGNTAAPSVPSKDVLKNIPMLWNVSNLAEGGAPASPSNAAATASPSATASTGKNASQASDFLFGSPKNVQGLVANNTMKPEAQAAAQPAAATVNASGSQAQPALAGLRDPLTLQTVLVNVTKAQPAGNASDTAPKASSAESIGASALNAGLNGTVAPGASSTSASGSLSPTVINASMPNSTSSPVAAAGLIVVQVPSLKAPVANATSPSGPNGNSTSSSNNSTGANSTAAAGSGSPASEQLTLTKSVPSNGTIPAGHLVINVTLGYNTSTVKPAPNASNTSGLARSIPYPVNRTRKHHPKPSKLSPKNGSRRANRTSPGAPLRTYPPSPFKVASLAGLATGNSNSSSNASAEAQPWSKFGNVTRLSGTDSIDPRNDSILIQEDQQLRLVHLASSDSGKALSDAAVARMYAPESAPGNVTNNTNSSKSSSSSGKTTVRIQSAPDQTSWFNTIADYLPSLTAFHRSLYAEDDTEPIVERTGEAPVPSEADVLSQGALGEAPVPSQSKPAFSDGRQRLGEAPIPSDVIQSEDDLVDDAAVVSGDDAAAVTSDEAVLSDDAAAAAPEDQVADEAAVDENQVTDEAAPAEVQISDEAVADAAVAHDAPVSDDAAANDDQVADAAATEDHADHEASANDAEVADEGAADEDDQAAEDPAVNDDQVAANDGEVAVNDQEVAEDEVADEAADSDAMETEAEGVDAVDSETAVAKGDDQVANGDQAVDAADAVDDGNNEAEAGDEVDDAAAGDDAIVDEDDDAIESTDEDAVIESGANDSAAIESSSIMA